MGGERVERASVGGELGERVGEPGREWESGRASEASGGGERVGGGRVGESKWGGESKVKQGRVARSARRVLRIAGGDVLSTALVARVARREER